MRPASYQIMDEQFPSTDEKTKRIFESKADKAQLEFTRLTRKWIPNEGESLTLKSNAELRNSTDLQDLQKDSNDLCQIFTIRQKRSWSTLNISKELFEDLTNLLGVFKPFWKCVFTFGKKYEEHECEFPGFQSQRTSDFLKEGSFEAAYVLRRVELHGRDLIEGESPWSIRQTGVYHKVQQSHCPEVHLAAKPQSKFLLLCPSNSGERQICRLLELAVSQQQRLPHSLIHSVLIADSVKGWMDYIAWIEKDLKERSDRIIFSSLSSSEKDFTFNVADRQALKIIEDRVVDLQIIVATLLSNIKGVQRHCRSSCQVYCKGTSGENCTCNSILEEFDSYLEEVGLCMERTKALRDRALSSAQLLSDLLRYEDQRALKDLTVQSQEENQTMLSLAEKSTKDAEATKVLTIIGLVYLPTTFVANFFSTEFVKADDNGTLTIAHQTWLLAVIALPLTVLTIIIWWLCVRYRNASLPHNMRQKFLQALKLPLMSTRQLKNRFRSDDAENEGGSQNMFVRVGPKRTWSTRASTLLPE